VRVHLFGIKNNASLLHIIYKETLRTQVQVQEVLPLLIYVLFPSAQKQIALLFRTIS